MALNNNLSLTWITTNNGTQGAFKDAHHNMCNISQAAWSKEKHIYITTPGGSLILSPEMCAELALVLGYIAFTGGDLPQPEWDEQPAKEDNRPTE